MMTRNRRKPDLMTALTVGVVVAVAVSMMVVPYI
jgi:hypothetical protein